MSLFTNLFSAKLFESPVDKTDAIVLIGNSRFELGIMGAERFQTALEVLGGPRVSRGVNRIETAWLILEDRNRQDKRLIRVEIRGKQVGYLSPAASALFCQYLLEQGKPKAKGRCQAVIQGGWVSSDGRKGDYEVWLDTPILCP